MSAWTSVYQNGVSTNLKRFDDFTYEKLTKSIELTNRICLPGSGNNEVKILKKTRPYLIVNIYYHVRLYLIIISK